MTIFGGDDDDVGKSVPRRSRKHATGGNDSASVWTLLGRESGPTVTSVRPCVTPQTGNAHKPSEPQVTQTSFYDLEHIALGLGKRGGGLFGKSRDSSPVHYCLSPKAAHERGASRSSEPKLHPQAEWHFQKRRGGGMFNPNLEQSLRSGQLKTGDWSGKDEQLNPVSEYGFTRKASSPINRNRDSNGIRQCLEESSAQAVESGRHYTLDDSIAGGIGRRANLRGQDSARAARCLNFRHREEWPGLPESRDASPAAGSRSSVSPMRRRAGLSDFGVGSDAKEMAKTLEQEDTERGITRRFGRRTEDSSQAEKALQQFSATLQSRQELDHTAAALDRVMLQRGMARRRGRRLGGQDSTRTLEALRHDPPTTSRSVSHSQEPAGRTRSLSETSLEAKGKILPSDEGWRATEQYGLADGSRRSQTNKVMHKSSDTWAPWLLEHEKLSHRAQQPHEHPSDLDITSQSATGGWSGKFSKTPAPLLPASGKSLQLAQGSFEDIGLRLQRLQKARQDLDVAGVASGIPDGFIAQQHLGHLWHSGSGRSVPPHESESQASFGKVWRNRSRSRSLSSECPIDGAVHTRIGNWEQVAAEVSKSSPGPAGRSAFSRRAAAADANATGNISMRERGSVAAYPSDGWLSKSSAASFSRVNSLANQAEATLTSARAQLDNQGPDFSVAEMPASGRPRSISPRPKLSLSAGMAAGGAPISSPSTPQRAASLQPSRLSRFDTADPKDSFIPVSYAMRPAAGKAPSDSPRVSRQQRAAARPLSRSPSAQETAPKVSWASQTNNASVTNSRGRSSSRGPGPSRGVPSVFPRSLSPAANSFLATR